MKYICHLYLIRFCLNIVRILAYIIIFEYNLNEKYNDEGICQTSIAFEIINVIELLNDFEMLFDVWLKE